MQLKLAIAIRPPKPTSRDEAVSLRIATRIVQEVNLDEFYWTAEELPDRIWDVQQEIMRSGYAKTVFARLHKAEGPDVGGGKYGWEGIDEHCRAIGQDITWDELAKAVKAWKERYL
jgi:hypothetical protein